MQLLYPKLYYKNIQSIDIQKLLDLNIKGLVLDVDNTLIDLDRNMPKGVKTWVENAKKNNIKMCILSNSNKKDKIEKVASILDVPYVYFAKKPLKSGFLKAKKILNLDIKNMAAVGDQIFTDILGANRVGITSILLESIAKKDYLITRIKRPLERAIIKKYKSVKGI